MMVMTSITNMQMLLCVLSVSLPEEFLFIFFFFVFLLISL